MVVVGPAQQYARMFPRAHEVQRGGDEQVLESGFGQANIPRPPEVAAPDALGDRSFHPSKDQSTLPRSRG
jgi:hypothetical protein